MKRVNGSGWSLLLTLQPLALLRLFRAAQAREQAAGPEQTDSGQDGPFRCADQDPRLSPLKLLACF
jgi:hypothetical protein